MPAPCQRQRTDWGTETGPIEVAVCSTRLIGDRPLDWRRVSPGSPRSCTNWRRGADGTARAARAIMTTDTCPNGCAAPRDRARGELDRQRDGQGARMMAPSFATMLAADRRRRRCRCPGDLRVALRPPRERSTDLTSTAAALTNDTTLLLASAPAIRPGRTIFDERGVGRLR